MAPHQFLASQRHASIVPDHEVELGAGNNAGVGWRIHDPVEMNAVAIWQGELPPIVLFSFDLLYPGQAVINAVLESVPGIPAENVLIAATHTHAAPMTDDAKPALGSPDDDYVRTLTDTIRREAALLLDPENREPVTLETSYEYADHSVNRRRRFPLYFSDGRLTRNAVIVAPDPSGPTDETVAIATLRGATGQPVAVLWNYACHPVGFPNPRTISAHFPGTVRRRIREHTGEDTAVLFFQGFSGDTRPRIRVQATTPANRLRQILFGYGSGSFREADLRDWSESLASLVVRNLATSHPRITPDVLASKHFVDGNEFAGPTDLDVAFQLISLGPEFSIVAISAELVHEYARYVRSLIPGRVTMCVGCTDVPLGYIPTSRMLQEGGYEAIDFCESFGLDSVKPGVEQATKDGFARLINSALAGRQANQ